ncbi:MAG: RidA family protein [Nitriliruptorales bacterium]|nr:RidA family protein [Nitriliruptorales bacterium]
MTGAGPEGRLAELGIVLPPAPAPAAAYVPTTRVADLVFISGQIAAGEEGLLTTGKIGTELDVEQGADCARQCALNVLAQLKEALGDLRRVRQVVKLTVFVASAPGMTTQHLVANGASELFGQVFGERGHHARSAVGVAALPKDSPVEVEAIVQVE